MAWTPLPTNYTDASWSGLKKYTQITNEDGTISFEDETSYTNKENSFFGAADANAMNEAINGVMGNYWENIPLSTFATMVNLIPIWTGSVQYNASLHLLRLHLGWHAIDMLCNTGDVIGTIQTAYLPKFTQYGQAMIWSSNKEILRPAVVTADGALSIGKAYDSAMPEVIDNLYFLDITYVTA